MLSIRNLTLVLFVAAGVMACGTTAETPAEDTGTTEDTSTDGSTDGGEDVVEDSGEDSGEDAGEDSGEDSGEDAGEDTGEDSGEDAGEDGGDVGIDATGCSTPNPGGCLTSGCADGEVCWTDFWPGISCTSSSCTCDPSVDGWLCTDDCGGGECVPAPGAACEEDADCPLGAQWCEDGVCEECNNDSMLCDIDCGDRGLLVRNGCHPCECNPENACEGEPETGCYEDANCDEGEECVEHDLTVCIPSACSCDASTGTWACSGDCAPGLCRPKVTSCETPNPAGCVETGCDEGYTCETFPDVPCVSSSCFCDEETGTWGCTDDCGGGICVPDTSWPCATDSDCVEGAQWCEDGACVDCDNSGFACRIACPEGETLMVRNGCHPCACAPINECTVDGDCEPWQACTAGDECLDWCPADDPTCCYGNTCVDLPD